VGDKLSNEEVITMAREILCSRSKSSSTLKTIIRAHYNSVFRQDPGQSMSDEQTITFLWKLLLSQSVSARTLKTTIEAHFDYEFSRDLQPSESEAESPEPDPKFDSDFAFWEFWGALRVGYGLGAYAHAAEVRSARARKNKVGKDFKE